MLTLIQKTYIIMYHNDFSGESYKERNTEDVFSKPIRAGKRTYFFDVKATKGNDYYLTITESKKRVESDGRFSFDKHKIFLYKEDFEKFTEGLQEVIDYIKAHCDVQETKHDDASFSNVNFEEL